MICYNHSMSHLAVFALGPLRIEIDGHPVQTSRHKALALLVYLALHPGQQTRETLSGFLWPEYEQEKASAYLRRTLWEIHRMLGESWLDADREAIGFNPDADLSLDVAEFQSHLTAIQRHDHPNSVPCPECISHLHTAALLYRGDFLDGFSLRDSEAFEEWQSQQREALRGDYARALQKLANLLVHAGAFSEAILFAQRWLSLDTFNEEAHRLLMKAYARSGQRHQAVRQYQECLRILQTELGVSPDAATTTLYEAVVTGQYSPADENSPQPSGNLAQGTSTTDAVAAWLGEAQSSQEMVATSSLPVPATPFVGRQQELDQIAALLADPGCWLLTLVGPGGIGKTRLAIEAGLQRLNQSAQRVFFIPLSAAETERSIAPAIARAIRLVLRQNGPAPEEQLLDFLREKRLLLILDSFEGLVHWAGLLEQIHTHAAGIQMLATSRQRLGLQGEWMMEVKGLDYPGKQPEKTEGIPEAFQTYSAVELFLQAARRARVTFQASTEELASVSRIAQLLEGMPLGLELAATWVNTLSCQEIADEISRGLDFLEASQWHGSERQRSMRAVFDRSWELLSAREQAILPCLSVFRGSFTRQAAEQAAGISLRELAGLVDQSLVRRTPQGRFDLHDLLRQYCTEKLDQLPADSQEMHDRHCAFYSARLAEWNAALSGVKQGQVLREIEADIDNLQAAWDWAIRYRQPDHLEQMVDGLCMFYLRRGRFTDGLETCQRAFEAIQADTPDGDPTPRARLSARLRTWQAAVSLNLERSEEAEQFLQESQSLLDDPHLDPHQVIMEQIFTLAIRGLLANLRYHPDVTLKILQQASTLAQKTTGKEPALFIFNWRYLMGGTISREIYMQIEKSLANMQPGSDPFELGCYLFVLGIAELFHAYRMEKAEPMLMESCQHFQQVDDPSTQVMIYMTLGYLLLVQGRFEEAYTLKQRELDVYQDIGDRRMIGIAQAEIGEVLCHQGKYPEAEEHIRMGMAFLHDRNESQFALRQRYLGDVLLAQGKYSEAYDAYQFSYNFFKSVDYKGWMLTALTGLSRTELALGNRSAAWEHTRQALQIHHDIHLFTFFTYLSVAEMALLLADRGETIQALELFGLVTRQGYLAQSRWFADMFGRVIETMAAHLPQEEQIAAKRRGQALDFSRTIDTLLTNS
jgi:DNA-binding SARP family transcriptional activator/predicted ATPase